LPAQTGPLLIAVARGKTLTITIVVAVLIHPLELVTVRVYIPAIANVALADTGGLLNVLVNPFGPVHEYVVIPAGPPVRLRALPAHTGPLLIAVARGKTLIITVVVAVLIHPLALFTIRVYIPAIAKVALADTGGLLNVLVNPFGPVHEYVVIPAGPPVRLRALPAHTGPLFIAAAIGNALTVTL
jgi:hypothetical protein